MSIRPSEVVDTMGKLKSLRERHWIKAAGPANAVTMLVVIGAEIALLAASARGMPAWSLDGSLLAPGRPPDSIGNTDRASGHRSGAVIDRQKTVVFTRTGLFHTPTPGDEIKVFNIPVPPAQTYRRVELGLDVTVGPISGANQSLFWLHRGRIDLATNSWAPWPGNVVAFTNYFPQKMIVRIMTNLNLPKPQRRHFEAGAQLTPGNTYHVSYIRDSSTGQHTVEITNAATGSAVTALSGPLYGGQLTTDEAGFFAAYFGHPHVKGGSERPTYGWKYQNLVVKFIP